jgi:hypothetical protein
MADDKRLTVFLHLVGFVVISMFTSFGIDRFILTALTGVTHYRQISSS